MIKKIKIFSLLVVAAALNGCSSSYISVDKVKTDKLTFASRFAKTPDPYTLNPPKGEKLYVNWSLPIEFEPHKYIMRVNIIYRNLTKETIAFPVKRRAGTKIIELLGKEFEQKKGFLVYKIQIVSLDDEIISDYTHRMWVDLILPCVVE